MIPPRAPRGRTRQRQQAPPIPSITPESAAWWIRFLCEHGGPSGVTPSAKAIEAALSIPCLHGLPEAWDCEDCATRELCRVTIRHMAQLAGATAEQAQRVADQKIERLLPVGRWTPDRGGRG